MRTRSSRYPRTGIGSGMRSIGLSAYATTHTAAALAYHGVRGSRAATYITSASRFTPRAQPFHRATTPMAGIVTAPAHATTPSAVVAA